MQTRSHAHLEVTINGHEVVGWAEDDPPYEFEEEDLVETKRGQDGGLYGLSMPHLGGDITLKLSPTSPTTQWAIQQKQEFKTAEKDKAAQTVYEGTFNDPVAGVNMNLAGGVFVNCPSFPTAGQTFEVMFRFEEFTSEVDGGTFHPPLTSEGSGGGAGTDFGI